MYLSGLVFGGERSWNKQRWSLSNICNVLDDFCRKTFYITCIVLCMHTQPSNCTDLYICKNNFFSICIILKMNKIYNFSLQVLKPIVLASIPEVRYWRSKNKYQYALNSAWSNVYKYWEFWLAKCGQRICWTPYNPTNLPDLLNSGSHCLWYLWPWETW